MKIIPRLGQVPLCRLKFDLKMKLSLFFLTISLFQLQANTSYAQKAKVTMAYADVPLERVLEEIESQTEFRFFYNIDDINAEQKVTIKADQQLVIQVLNTIFQSTLIQFKVTGKQIVLTKRSDPTNTDTQQQFMVNGTVTDEDGVPLVGATVRIKDTNIGVATDFDGKYEISVPDENTVLVVTSIGYLSRELRVGKDRTIPIVLKESVNELDEVVLEYSTGYQKIPEERATGSFVQVDNKLINRSVGTDIISRLEGVTSGLFFDKRGAGSGSAMGLDYRNLRIRGISSINSETNPLIVVDGFPFEGDINTLNPNDIKDITILKDAAAASIWGARAANGVIVITMKEGGFRQRFELNFYNNTRIGLAPDLKSNPNYLSSSDFIDVERSLFEQGFYDADESNITQPLLSPAVEIMIAQRDGVISDQEAERRLAMLRQYDVREDVQDQFYRNSFSQQYALNFQGGGEMSNYYVSAGYDSDKSFVVGNNSERLTLAIRNTIRPIERLQVQTGIELAFQQQDNNGISWGGYESQYPYNRLVDGTGNPLAVGRGYRIPYVADALNQGLLDWSYVPVEERRLMDDQMEGKQQRINIGVEYEPVSNLKLSLFYQFQNRITEDREVIAKERFYVRDLVNRFTDENGNSPFPNNDILQMATTKDVAQGGRFQISTEQRYGKSNFSGLAGLELREVHREGQVYEYYDYDDDVLTTNNQLDYRTYYVTRPAGRSRIPTPNASLSDHLDRYLSYYGNVAYTYDDRYTLTGSARWDASNLFGVKTNQKGVPLWSAGLAWTLSNEDFYDVDWMPQLKLRGTYGYNGNINKQATAFVTSRYISAYMNDFQTAEIRSPGNPQLTWEKVEVLNLGLDVQLGQGKLTTSFEYFLKNGEDLLGLRTVDPTTGFSSLNYGTGYMANYANTRTEGWDWTLKSLNIDGAFQWQTDFFMSHAVSELTHFDEDAVTSSIYNFFNNNSIKLKENTPLDALYAVPWHGLDPGTGAPLVMVDNELGTEYDTYFNTLEFDDLKRMGLGVPSYFGSFRNTFSWKNFALSANITFKLDYVFRASSIDYNWLYTQDQGHRDFSKRWQMPGDELTTIVPSMPTLSESSQNRDAAYTFSEKLIEKGDHIRLQDIRLAYQLDKLGAVPGIRNMELYFYVDNPGILWRANSRGLDPDYPSAQFLPGPTYALGVNVKL